MMFILISLKQPDVVECIIYSLLGPWLGLVLEPYRALKYQIFLKKKKKFHIFYQLGRKETETFWLLQTGGGGV